MGPEAKTMKAKCTRSITLICVSIHTHTYLCIICIYTWCIYIYIHIYIYTHKYTYIYIYYIYTYIIQYVSKSSRFSLKSNIKKTRLQHHPPSCRVLNPGDWDLRFLSESTQLVAKIFQGHGPGAHQLRPDLNGIQSEPKETHRNYVFNMCVSIEYRYMFRLWFRFRLS
jgi:hypothetical protein